MNLRKMIISGVATLSLSPIAATLGNGIFTTQVVRADALAPSYNDKEVTYISNEEIFDHLEAQGYNVKSILGEEAYAAALKQDLTRAGGTYIQPNKHGFTLYINSAICKVAVWGGAGAIAYAVATALTAAGLGSVSVNAISAIASSVINGAGAKATQRGVYIRYSTKGNMLSWGYQ